MSNFYVGFEIELCLQQKRQFQNTLESVHTSIPPNKQSTSPPMLPRPLIRFPPSSDISRPAIPSFRNCCQTGFHLLVSQSLRLRLIFVTVLYMESRKFLPPYHHPKHYTNNGSVRFSNVCLFLVYYSYRLQSVLA